jgi:NAD(P)-dependent dehydrogenase (short-subunit alcohol dehydrogenase family)
MKTVVITGSTRGIGLGLACEFIKAGCRVVVSGRKQENVDRVVAELSEIAGSDHVKGIACDVSDPAQVQALWQASSDWTNHVDIWINNAGTSHLQMPPWQIAHEVIQGLLRANIEGLINGSNVAVTGMLKQGSGAIYNMEGLGSDGRKVAGLSIYGTSKAAVRYFTEALILETKGTPVLVGALSPGMVLTDLLLKQKERSPEEWRALLKVYNLFADRVEDVTPWLTAKILQNQKHGAAIRYLTPMRIMRHFFASLLGRRDLSKEIQTSL